MEVEKKLSKKLTEKEKAIIINTILLSCTEAEIAKKMGTSQQAVHKGKKRALEKLRNKLYS
jgi:RNA polymerase sigma factor (sigma-70 family)